MIKEIEIKDYFQAVDKVLDKANDLRKAWKYLVKKLKGLEKNSRGNTGKKGHFSGNVPTAGNFDLVPIPGQLRLQETYV